MKNSSNTAAAAAPADYARKLQTEQSDLARKMTRKIADFVAERVGAQDFIRQIGGISGAFFSRIQSNFKEEHLRAAFPNVYPFEDFRIDFQDRVEELLAEREANKAPDDNFKTSLIKITEEFLAELTGVEV